MTFIVLTSDGEIHETDDRDEYVRLLDEHGNEVVDSYEEAVPGHGARLAMAEDGPSESDRYRDCPACKQGLSWDGHTQHTEGCPDSPQAEADRQAQWAKEDVTFKQDLQREARSLRVPMTHDASDEEYMPVLSYCVDQEIMRASRRVRELKLFRDRFTA